MAMQISRYIYTEVSEKKALRGGEETPWRGVPPACGAKGVQDRGGTYHAGSRPHADQRAAETGGIERGGLHQRQECDPCGEALFETRTQLCGATNVGTRIFRGHGGKGHGDDTQVHPGTGVGGSQAGAA